MKCLDVQLPVDLEKAPHKVVSVFIQTYNQTKLRGGDPEKVARAALIKKFGSE